MSGVACARVLREAGGAELSAGAVAVLADVPVGAVQALPASVDGYPTAGPLAARRVVAYRLAGLPAAWKRRVRENVAYAVASLAAEGAPSPALADVLDFLGGEEP
ncbi:hypothetical protein SAMN05216355_1337 [Actinomyces ruminicola]|uniref:Uncharacterized protein n=1 Tax=Actinomyces ruminicola TaxID=332524 RepID=A0A1H0FLP9_9ACTO|nr:hypothetical protein SAMN05216355_1337 [Actinomyces ruminicola]